MRGVARRGRREADSASKRDEPTLSPKHGRDPPAKAPPRPVTRPPCHWARGNVPACGICSANGLFLPSSSRKSGLSSLTSCCNWSSSPMNTEGSGVLFCRQGGGAGGVSRPEVGVWWEVLASGRGGRRATHSRRLAFLTSEASNSSHRSEMRPCRPSVVLRRRLSSAFFLAWDTAHARCGVTRCAVVVRSGAAVTLVRARFMTQGLAKARRRFQMSLFSTRGASWSGTWEQGERGLVGNCLAQSHPAYLPHQYRLSRHRLQDKYP